MFIEISRKDELGKLQDMTSEVAFHLDDGDIATVGSSVQWCVVMTIRHVEKIFHFLML